MKRMSCSRYHIGLAKVGTNAMAVVTCVGSLIEVLIRHANRPEDTRYQ